MTKILLGVSAAALLIATPAFAQDDSTLKLTLGGHFKGYVNYTDQDDEFTAVGTGAHDVDILRQTEIHFGGETTLDNGLTIGAQIEAVADGGESFEVDESYIYMAGSWGRVNLGDEDGAAYLLQVAAPSADDNIDGIRQFINPVNLGAGSILQVGTLYGGGIDYDNATAGNSDKITYLTPVFSGFQAGFSWAPEINDTSRGGNGNSIDGNDDALDNIWEVAGRYEGSFNNIGMILGAGYTGASVENEVDVTDFNEWNVGADFDIGAFGIGAIYTKNKTDFVVGSDSDTDTWVVGGDYTTGPFKIGVSYLDQNFRDVIDIHRITGGVVYTYGPGMSFRGSVSHLSFNDDGGDDPSATSVLIGTQINF